MSFVHLWSLQSNMVPVNTGFQCVFVFGQTIADAMVRAGIGFLFQKQDG